MNSPNLSVLIAFIVLSSLVLLGAIVTVTRKNLISAAMSLVATFFGVSGLYAMLCAHFLAAIQILVYAGGIMVLFVFVIMVLNREETARSSSKGIFGKVVGSSVVLYLCIRLGFVLYVEGSKIEQGLLGMKLAEKYEFGTVKSIGDVLFKELLFPFEAISILLIIAVIAAVVLARSFAVKATSMYEIPEGEKKQNQPARFSSDEIVITPDQKELGVTYEDLHD